MSIKLSTCFPSGKDTDQKKAAQEARILTLKEDVDIRILNARKALRTATEQFKTSLISSQHDINLVAKNHRIYLEAQSTLNDAEALKEIVNS